MKKSWQKVFIRRDSDMPTICGMILTAYKYLWEYKKDKKEYLFGYSKDGHYHYFCKDFDRYAFGRHLYKKYFNSPAGILQFYHKGQTFLSLTRVKTSRWQKKLESNGGQEFLLAAFMEFEKDFEFINDNYSIMPWWATEAWQYDFEKILSSLVQKQRLAHRYDEIIAAVTKPWKQTAITQIKKDYQQGASVASLVKKYQFLRSWTAVWHKPIDKEWIQTALSGKSRTKSSTITIKQALELLKPSVEEKIYFNTAPYLVFFKDWRDDLRRQQSFLWQFLWANLGRYFGISASDVGYFTFTEIEQGLRTNKLDLKLIRKRKSKTFLILIDKPKLDIKILTGKFPKIYSQVIKKDQTFLGNKEVSGIIGQPGKVIGKVRIIQGVKDLHKIKQGEILVANTTHPDYLLAMKKAAAFITDEGGIASHAAIVARELRLPCIVGTKIATKVFKDGDFVEVDANQGVVKKL